MGTRKKGKRPAPRRVAGFKLEDLLSVSFGTFSSTAFKQFVSKYAADKNVTTDAIPQAKLLELYDSYLRRGK